jgi:aminodeoxyfutalosine synthase
MTVLGALAERVSRGEDIAEQDAELILASHDLLTIGAMADDVRRRMHGARTTFVRVMEVHVDAPPSAIPASAAAGEIRIVGHPRSTEAAVAAVRAASVLAHHVPVTGFSLHELVELASEERIRLEDVCGRLRSAGLYAVAELPVDVMADAEAAVERARGAGLAVLRMTVHTLSADARLSLVARARNVQQSCGGFRVFAPLPRIVPVTTPTTGYDDVKQIAIARLLGGNFPSIQVDWPLYGPKLAQVALTMGADDVDGVAAFDAGKLGTRRSAIEEIRRNITAAALDPVERNARFEVTG